MAYKKINTRTIKKKISKKPSTKKKVVKKSTLKKKAKKKVVNKKVSSKKSKKKINKDGSPRRKTGPKPKALQNDIPVNDFIDNSNCGIDVETGKALDATNLEPQQLTSEDIPSSSEIEENEKFINLERNAGVKSNGKKPLKKLTDTNKRYLGQLSWYWRLKGLSFQKIADKYDISIGLIYRLYNQTAKEMQNFMDEEADYHINIELMRLDEMMHELLPYCKKHTHEEIVSRRWQDRLIVRKIAVERAPLIEAIDRVLKIMERKSKFLGLDKPTRQEVEVTDKKFVAFGPPKTVSTEQWAKDGGTSVKEQEKKNPGGKNSIVRH